MSHAATKWCKQLAIKGWAKSVLLCLADCHNGQTGQCDPSIATISFTTGCDERTARKALKELVEVGVISRSPRRATSDAIEINFEWNPLPKMSPPDINAPPPINVSTPSHFCEHPPPKNETTPLPKMRPKLEVTGIREPEGTGKDVQADSDEETALAAYSRSTGLRVVAGSSAPADGSAGRACDHARDAWNESAGRCDWPQVQRFTPVRSKALHARLAEIGGLEGWNVMLGKLEASPWIRYQPCLTFDWVLKPANLTKIMEGNYDAKSSGAPAANGRGTVTAFADAAALLRDKQYSGL